VQTEQAVRAYLADLEAVLARPCPCCGEEGNPLCVRYAPMFSTASLLMQSAEVLRWIVGENPDFDRLVDQTAYQARRE
jgi:hypothetical protein